MPLVRSEDLALNTEGYFGREFRVLQKWICRHGGRHIVVESGWMWYTPPNVCKCCDVEYGYHDSTDDASRLKPLDPKLGIATIKNKGPIATEDFCSFCSGQVEA